MSELYADIIVDISHEKLDKTFQYRVPQHLRETIEPGSCVRVPFGNANKPIAGYVLAVSPHSQFDPARTKDILDIVENRVLVEDKRILLAAWMRKHYGATMIQALRTVLPVKQSVKKLEHQRIECLLDREALLSLYEECERKKQVAKARLLKACLQQKVFPKEWATKTLGISASTYKSLERAKAIRVVTVSAYRNPVNLEAIEEKQEILTKDQQHIVDTVYRDYVRGVRQTYLIHGVTGSGKTSVYIALIARILKEGRQAIVLIPEIALTQQTLQRFYRRFGNRVSVMNSMLSDGEKYDQCERAKNGEIDVIIGPRSALFTPFRQVGLIIIDEEHETSYKSESTPKYHARETAQEVARLYGASVVLGSATPSIESFYRAKNGIYRYFRLQERFGNGQLPKVYTVDLRQELREGNRSIFSRKLQALLAERLQRGEQSILFLNRRGYAGFVSCRSCGHVVKCPHCDVSLAQHEGGRLQCHYCGYSEPMPSVCPQCQSKYIMGFRAGTEQIQQKLKELFPQVRILRMDADTTRKKGSYEKILSAFARQEADVLIGTQMIVKGHDFPMVTLVGVIAADLSLSATDYRAGERTFQLLTQAVGRAGRGERPGEAVIQTYQPQHYAVVHAATQDYERFYDEEIVYRQLAGYPPIAHMLAVQVFGDTQIAAKELAQQLSDVVKSIGNVQVMGPAPGSIGKVKDVYRFVTYVKQRDYEELIAVKDRLEEWLREKSPREMVLFDFDPMNLL